MMTCGIGMCAIAGRSTIDEGAEQMEPLELAALGRCVAGLAAVCSAMHGKAGLWS
jgi:hypothetical protein